MEETKYSYKFRPAYGQTWYIIEFYRGSDHEDMIKDLLEALSEINPSLMDTMDLWMNDEVVLKMGSSWGSFDISKDGWGGVFIMNEHDQSCIETIHDILYCNPNYESLKVDPSEYVLKDE
jgi:hypothetical protein